MSYESPVRAIIKAEIFDALASAGHAMSAAQLADVCHSAPDSNEVARIAYEMRVKKGLLEFGEDVLEPGKRPVKTYRIASVDSAEAWASRVAASDAVAKAQAPKKAKKSSVHPADANHPWKQPVVPPKADKPPRVTRPLPSHLQSVAPRPVADNSHMAQWMELAEPTIATSDVVDHENHFVMTQDAIDSALIAALQDVAIDLPKATDLPTEKHDMSEDIHDYSPEHFTLIPEAPVEPLPIPDEGCRGHCANHARDEETLLETLSQAAFENVRLAIVDAMLIHANRELRGDRVWKSLERAYQAATGDKLEAFHG